MEESIDTLGSQFKKAREGMGLSLDVISKTLKIPVKSLKALEEENYNLLPPIVYARGFVKLYAEYLGFDPVRSVEIFSQNYPGKDSDPNTPPKLTPKTLRPLNRLSISFDSRFLAIAGGVFFLMLAAVYFFVEIRGFTKPPELEITAPEKNIEILGNSLKVTGKTDPTVEIRINGEKTFVKSDGTFEETLGVGMGINKINVVATSVGGRESTVTREVLVKDSAAAVSPSASPEVSPIAVGPDSPIKFKVKAKEESVWISLTVDGESKFSGILLPDGEQEAEGKEIRISSGKADKTLLTVDGREEVMDNVPGAVRNIVFTRDTQSGTVKRQEIKQQSPQP